MGSRMGQCVMRSGLTIVAYDRDAQRLAESGLPPAESASALVDAVDVVLLSLPDSSIIEPLILGDDGLARAFRAGQVLVDLSTASPESTVRIADELARCDVAVIDAGISGGAKAAEAGTLTLMTGGEDAVLERVRPVLETFASKIVAMGPVGAGHTAKILNNFLNGISLAATAEVMLAGKRAGLDLERLLEVLNASSGVNFATLNRFPSIVKGDYLEGGLTGRLMAKDVRLYLDLVARVGAPTFTGPACLATFEVANGLGYGDVISNRVVDGLGDLVGGVRIQPAQGEREAR